MQIKHIMVY